MSAYPHLDMFLMGINESALVAFIESQLYAPYRSVPPVNYRVFGYVPPAIVFDFNVDGQAYYYCSPRHLVLEPHRTIDREIIESPSYPDLLRGAADSDVAVPSRSTPIPPGPEPPEITNTDSYRWLIRAFRAIPCIVFVGYSFGRQLWGIDDFESAEFFADLLKWSPKPVVVVDPFRSPLLD